MTRFDKIYESYKKRKALKPKAKKSKHLSREGYGYIKRRLGLLSNEIGTPTHLVPTEISELAS